MDKFKKLIISLSIFIIFKVCIIEIDVQANELAQQHNPKLDNSWKEWKYKKTKKYKNKEQEDFR